MRIEELNKDSWSGKQNHGPSIEGYLADYIVSGNAVQSNLLIFRDSANKNHFVAGYTGSAPALTDPNVNGLTLSLKKFKLNTATAVSFIDLECTSDEYEDEFAEIVKEISTKILDDKADPLESILQTIDSWKSFWSSRIREILEQEKQLGLYCELVVLKSLCEINPALALNCWTGPSGEKYDFTFSDWVFEVKGTKGQGHIHQINGLDQLKQPDNKRLAVVSFVVSIAATNSSKDLQSLIDFIYSSFFKNKPPLSDKFYRLLSRTGYSRIFADEYRKVKYDIISSVLFPVDEQFPRLTSEYLTKPLSVRVSNLTYKIDLQGFSGEPFNSVQLGNYFY